MWVCVSVLYVCMYVCKDVYVTFKPVTNTKRGPEITGVLRTVVQPGELSSAYTVHCQQGFGLAWNKCELFRFEPKFLFIAIQNIKTWIFRQQCRPICEVYLFILPRTRKTCTFLKQTWKRLLLRRNQISHSCNNFWTRHCGYFHGLYIP